MTMWIAATFVAFGGCTSTMQGTPPSNISAAVDRAVRSPLVGSWHLIWLDLPGPDGALRRISDAKGSLIYTPSGQVSVQVMYANSSDTPSSGPVQYAQGGYEGSFGQYVVDDATRTVTHRYAGANVSSLLGKEIPRQYELSGQRLVLRSTRADEHWAVSWERDPAAVR
jgi:hypothetical protein